MRIYCYLLFIVLSQGVLAQSVPRMLEMADTLYASNRYLDAIEFYDKITGIDKQNYLARYRLGVSYKETLQYEKAMEVFIRLANTPGHDYRAKSYYYYANLLRLDEKFKEADSIYSLLITVPDADPDLIELSRKQREGCLMALRQQKVERGFTITPFEEVNSRFHDFGAVLNPATRQVVMATTRNAHEGQYEGNQFYGLLPDLMVFEKRRNDRFAGVTNSQNFDILNTSWAEGSGTFTRNGKTFYFSTCKGEGGADCVIMVSYLINDRWTPPVTLNKYINEPGSENKQPSVTPLGDTLFFSSNRPGSLGGSDIWMSLKGLDQESWTPAINMGGVINSPEEEISPYYSSAGNCLLFSSDGHVGYGGYDIYLAKGESFFEPEIYNLGDPFNSTLDDTYFNISDSIGFLASNREDHNILDVYYFNVNDEQLFLSLLISGETLIQSRIISKFRDIRSLDLITFRVEDYNGFQLFDPEMRDKPRPKIIPVDVVDAAYVASVTQNSKTSYTTPDPNSAGQVTPAMASVNSSTPSSSSNSPFSTTGSDASAVPLAYEPNASSVSKNNTNFENLYFDFGLYQLRSEAKVALNDLVGQLEGKAYNLINIQAYTDNIGRENYNLDLSEERGESVKKYLVNKGIPAGKLQVLARGEINDEQLDHWFKRIMSRKVEILVDASPSLDLRSANTYIVRKGNTVRGIAELLGITEDDIRKWNGIKTDVITAGSTIRILHSSKTPDFNHFVGEKDLKRFANEKEGFQ